MSKLDGIIARAHAFETHGTPGRHAPEDRKDLLAALRAVEALAADWKADYRAMIPDESRGAEYIYADGRDDAANEIQAAICEALS